MFPYTTGSVSVETVPLTLVSLTCPLIPAAIAARRPRSKLLFSSLLPFYLAKTPVPGVTPLIVKEGPPTSVSLS